MRVVQVILILIGSLVAVIGLAGICIFTSYTIIPGPIYLRNNFIGLWLSIIIVFLALEFIYSLAKSDLRIISLFFTIFNMIYYILVGLAGFFLAIAYGLVWRADTFGMGLTIMFIAASSAAVIIIRRKKIIEKKSREINSNVCKNTMKATSEIEDSTSSSNAKLLEQSPDQKDSCRKTSFRIVNVLLKLFWLGILGLLCNGGFEIGFRKFWYPARGKFMNVPLNDQSGRFLRIHYLCEGPANSSHPIILFEGNFGQSLVDFVDLQQLMVKAGRRSCIWDKAGVGYSDFLFEDMAGNYSLYYNNFVRELVACGEKAPFTWVAWGNDGASLVYSYALESPEMVSSITYLDVLPPQFELTAPAFLKNLTGSELNSFIRFEMIKKYIKILLINNFGVPFGLMRYLYRAEETQKWWRQNPERSWHYYTEKSWATQRYFLNTVQMQRDVYASQISKNITVNHIMSVKDDKQILNLFCLPKSWTVESSDCSYELRVNKYSIDVKRGLIRGSGKVIECAFDACNNDYLLYRDPQFTVNSLLALYQ